MAPCSIVQCSARKDTNHPELTLHRFPRNEVYKKAWLEAIGIENMNPRHREWYICSLHFPQRNINKTLNVRRLHDNTIPTENLPKNYINTIMNNIVLVPAHQVTTHREASPCTSVETAPLLPLEEKPPEKKNILTQTMKFTTERERILEARARALQQRLFRRDKKFKQLQVLFISLSNNKRKKMDEL